MSVSRREFLKVATAATAAGMSPMAQRVLLEPFVRPPEEVLPGEAAWYASACRQCSAGCGIIVRVLNGRAKKIEGNPLHPLNRGKLCARGQAGLQALYHPDRLRNAVQQTGGRGSRRFEPLPWPQAFELLAQRIRSIGSPGRMLFWADLLPDHLFRLASGLLESLGAPPPLVFDPHTAMEGRASAARLSGAFFGSRQLPVYDVGRADAVFSFGANFLETWMSPVAQSVAYGDMRQGQRSGRGFLVQFEPRLSATGASADEWISLRPGAEGFVALAIGRIIVEERLGHVGSHRPHAVLYQNVDVGEMAQASAVPAETLARLARIFADADRPVAIPGGNLAGQRNGFSSMLAVQALNLVAAQIGRIGGVFLSHPGPTPSFQLTPEASTFAEVLEAIDRMRSGEVDLLMVYGANPMLGLPQAAGMAEAIARVPYVVSFSPFVDETAVRSDLILPDHTYLESWGYQVPSPGADRPVVTGQQPVVRPLHDTRSTSDVILALAQALGGRAAQALPWADEVAFLAETAQDLFGSSLGLYDARTHPGFWALWRQHGGWWSENEILREPVVTEIAGQPLPIEPPRFEGDEGEFPFHLHPYPSITLSDGRGAHLPWLQETPDPMTTASWSTWVEISPSAAGSLGVTDNDVVRVVSPFGELEAPVVVHPGLRPDTIAIPAGQGHQDYGRFAMNRGQDPLRLVAPVTDESTGGLAWGATRVRIEPTGKRYPLARLENLDAGGRETLG